MAEWRYIGHCFDGQRFEIDGINVWDHPWTSKEELRAVVKDPGYLQTYDFHVYEIVADSKCVVFAAGEFSNSIFGFYVQ